MRRQHCLNAFRNNGTCLISPLLLLITPELPFSHVSSIEIHLFSVHHHHGDPHHHRHYILNHSNRNQRTLLTSYFIGPMCTWGPIIALGVNIFGKIFSLFLFFCEKPLIQQSSNRAWPKGKGSKTVLIVDYPPHSLDCLSSHTYLCFYPISFLFVCFC